MRLFGAYDWPSDMREKTWVADELAPQDAKPGDVVIVHDRAPHQVRGKRIRLVEYRLAANIWLYDLM
jgi:hypothetical protein